MLCIEVDVFLPWLIALRGGRLVKVGGVGEHGGAGNTVVRGSAMTCGSRVGVKYDGARE